MTNAHRPTIEVILQRFFAEQRAGKKGLTLARIELIERRMRECVESEAEHILVPADVQILAAEREFEAADAVARTMHADDLLFLLTLFVKEPWLPEERVQRTRHLQVTEKLMRFLLNHGLIDRYGLACPLLDIEVAVDQERMLRRDARRQKRIEANREAYYGSKT